MVAIGDVRASHQSVANNSYLTILPASPEEWTIHNIYIPLGMTCRIYRTEGTHDVEIMEVTGSLIAFYFHVNATYYLKVKNISGTPLYIGYDGIASKVS